MGVRHPTRTPHGGRVDPQSMTIHDTCVVELEGALYNHCCLPADQHVLGGVQECRLADYIPLLWRQFDTFAGFDFFASDSGRKYEVAMRRTIDLKEKFVRPLHLATV